MLAFPCTSCGQRLTLAETWAGKKCRCGVCGQVLDVPLPGAARLAAPTANQTSVSQDYPVEKSELQSPPSPKWRAEEGGRRTRDHSSTDEPTLPLRPTKAVEGESPSSGPATILESLDVELYDFLAPPETAGEIGRLGGYRILKVLGSGGMGVVFQAEDLQLRRPAALKTMRPALAAGAVNRRRFHQEAQAAAAIEHDHIVTIYQVGEDRGVPFIAMQLLRGESLEKRLGRAGRLDVGELLRVGRETASGLAVAHERGLIHRDIKPSNIWLEVRDGMTRVKILDFGLARSLADNANLTGSGTILGTPAYMAPEQARGQAVDARVDLFSLGCVLYRAATGQPAFRGADTIATLMAVAEHTPPPPHQVNPRLPPPVSQFIMMLLAKEASARPPSARVVIQAIEKLEHERMPNGAEMSASALPKATPIETAGSLPNSPSPADRDAPTLRLEEDLPRRNGKSRLLLASILGIAAGFALLIALGILALGLWLIRPQADPSPSASAKTTAPGGNADNRPEGPPTLSAEVQALLRDAVHQKNYSKTNIVGFPFAPEFEEVPSEGALLIGFEVGLGKFGANDVIHSIRAIYRNDKGELFGDVHGKPTDRVVTVKAKPGYAVGTVRLNTHLLIDGMRITFMRIEGKFLDADHSYVEKIATIGDGGSEPSLGGGSLVVGVCGKADARVCNAFGLVLRGKTAK
jgi:serine/threonine protein kinase